jgi:hypothetical protein
MSLKINVKGTDKVSFLAAVTKLFNITIPPLISPD